ncbi:MAG: succinylglutamate desuccinylase/aspartoacylase family protein [Cyclobacteriaceae bacterium]
MMNRILDDISGEKEGPLVILVAGIHGNETVGIDAAKDIFRKIRDHKVHLNGRLIGILGNLQAIATNQRFLAYDLNRAWKEDYINLVSEKSDHFAHPEDRELKELHLTVDELLAGDTHEEKILVDLHATSSDKGNFIIVPEAEADHDIVKALHLPVVIDMEKYLEGTLLNYYQHHGVISFAFEGGLIGSKEAVELHESGIWEILDTAGMISHHDHEEVDHYEKKLRAISDSLPSKVKAFYRHWVDREDEFVMKPGFSNFQEIEKGQLLARDKHGPIFAPAGGMIFMPLYQDSGNDGFFLVQELTREEPVNLYE